jgi:hypothetical protein
MKHVSKMVLIATCMAALPLIAAESKTEKPSAPPPSASAYQEKLKEARARDLAAMEARRKAAAKRLKGVSPILNPVIAPFDANRNGLIEPAEWAKYREAVERKKSEAAKSPSK